MVRSRRAAGAVVGLWGMLSASCLFDFDSDYTGTRYMCAAGDACPPGFTCVDRRCVDQTPADFTDDAAGGGFQRGTFAGTQLDGDHLRLVAGTSGGEFVSRVFDSGLAEASWTRIEWTPGGPYGVVPASAADFSTGTDDFTWSMWLQTTEACLCNDSLGNDIYLGADDDRQTGAHLWFGCARAITGECPAGGAASGRLGGTLISVSGNETDGGVYCGTRDITDGVWHHLVLTKTGHAPATIETWIDGARDFSGQITFQAPIVFDAGLPFNIAGEPTPRETAGTFDEIAIWRRALSGDQVRALYLRGVRQLGIQLRACAEPDCADDPPFVGPGSAPGAEFVDLAGGGPSVPVDLDGVRGRYFQYRASFAGVAAPDGSPELHAVRLTLAR